MGEDRIKDKFVVVQIAKDLINNPDCKKDTLKYPHLVEYVEDEYDIFVVNVVNGEFYPARDFFYLVNVDEFDAIVEN